MGEDPWRYCREVCFGDERIEAGALAEAGSELVTLEDAAGIKGEDALTGVPVRVLFLLLPRRLLLLELCEACPGCKDESDDVSTELCLDSK